MAEYKYPPAMLLFIMQAPGLTHTPCFLQDFLLLLLLTFHLLRNCWQLHIIFESNLENLSLERVSQEEHNKHQIFFFLPAAFFFFFVQSVYTCPSTRGEVKWKR